MDAIGATLLALTVVEPQSSGIGGGGLLVYQDASGSGPVTFDGRETAPASASPALFLTPDGKPQPRSTAVPGGRSVGVPGNVAMLALAHARLGKLPWAALFAPAIALAEDGYIVTPRLSAGIAAKRDVLARSPAAAALYLNADGSAKAVGTRILNPALAATLRAIAAGGPDAFYKGPLAVAVAQTVQTAPTNPTVMTAADLAAYQAKARLPICTLYRVWRVCGMGPPSSGGTSVAAILRQLERFDLSALGPDNPVSWHLLAESERLAFADRDAYLGDSDFVAVPVAGLVDPAYLASRSALIHVDRTMASVSAGTPPGAAPRTAAPAIREEQVAPVAAAPALAQLAQSYAQAPAADSGDIRLVHAVQHVRVVPAAVAVPACADREVVPRLPVEVRHADRVGPVTPQGPQQAPTPQQLPVMVQRRPRVVAPARHRLGEAGEDGRPRRHGGERGVRRPHLRREQAAAVGQGRRGARVGGGVGDGADKVGQLAARVEPRRHALEAGRVRGAGRQQVPGAEQGDGVVQPGPGRDQVFGRRGAGRGRAQGRQKEEGGGKHSGGKWSSHRDAVSGRSRDGEGPLPAVSRAKMASYWRATLTRV